MCFVRKLLAILIAFAIVGGTSVQSAQAAGFAAATMLTVMPCDQMMGMADAGHSVPMAPCKGMTPDCIKQMGCVTVVALPVRMVQADTAFDFTMVVYWSVRSGMISRDSVPEPLPPRAI